MLALPFNNPTTYKGHSGVDFGQPLGADILAGGSGVVVFSGLWNSRAGYGVIVRYDNGIEVLYCHMPENSLRPATGTRVELGGYLGEVGSSGNSTGYHLHMEIMKGKGAHTYEGIWLHFTTTTVASLKQEKIVQEDEDAMLLLYVYIEGDKDPKGVIGSINIDFETKAEREHFINIWGTEKNPKHGVKIGSTVTTASFVPQVLKMHVRSRHSTRNF